MTQASMVRQSDAFGRQEGSQSKALPRHNLAFRHLCHNEMKEDVCTGLLVSYSDLSWPFKMTELPNGSCHKRPTRINSMPLYEGSIKLDTTLTLVYKQADRLLVIILWVMLALSLAISGMHNTMGWALWLGLPVVVLASAVSFKVGGSRISQIVNVSALIVMCALQIHQGHGREELHFGIFVGLAFLLCYRDWRVIVFAAGLVAVHHLGFNYLQELGYGVICLTKPGLAVVLVHAGYVVAETAVLCYLAVMLRREAVQSAELRASVALLRSDSKVIDLRKQATASSESGQALQEVLDHLHAAVARVQGTVQTTRSSANQIAEGSSDLRARTQEQVESIRDAVDAMAELSRIIETNSANAQQANSMSSAASTVAERGGRQAGDVVERMDAIDKSSKKIADIIGVIDGIAFQTNILALNAAVEAARAGEQGRGFAVVASEVRNLAQRSSGAAKEIKALIEQSVAEVSAGSALAREAGATMQEIVSNVAAVSKIIGDISGASVEQANRVSSVSAAISEMNKSTNANASMVDETAGAVGTLQEQAEMLAQVVSVFRLDGARA
jgi:methyl-accepting chemotaxis protein